jgi:hypothetical protein
MERLKQYAATDVVAALMFGMWLLVAHVAEKDAPPSYTPNECAAGDRQCAEWMQTQEEEK